MHFDNTYVKIDLDIISANFEAVQKKSGVKVMAWSTCVPQAPT